MCDYSLAHIASRAAAVGDKLVSSKFPSTISRGFAAHGAPDVVVCMLPGTEIAFDENIVTQPVYNFVTQPVYNYAGQPVYNYAVEAKTHEHRTARFRQINLEQPYAHHDALELPDGTQILLHELREGQTATVLQLPAAPKTEQEAQEQKRLEVVG